MREVGSQTCDRRPRIQLECHAREPSSSGVVSQRYHGGLIVAHTGCTYSTHIRPQGCTHSRRGSPTRHGSHLQPERSRTGRANPDGPTTPNVSKRVPAWPVRPRSVAWTNHDESHPHACPLLPRRGEGGGGQNYVGSRSGDVALRAGAGLPGRDARRESHARHALHIPRSLPAHSLCVHSSAPSEAHMSTGQRRGVLMPSHPRTTFWRRTGQQDPIRYLQYARRGNAPHRVYSCSRARRPSPLPAIYLPTHPWTTHALVMPAKR